MANLEEFGDFGKFDEDDGNVKEKVVLENKYKVKPPIELISTFEVSQKQKVLKKIEENERKIVESQIEHQKLLDSKVDDDEDDIYKGFRVHAWVLILPGKRDVTEAFFIEPNTGEIHPLTSKAYFGIETLFSHTNFWVNMQSCQDGLKNLSFQVNDTNKWEFVVVEQTPTSPVVEVSGSWVDKLDISLDQFSSQCPIEGKVKQYRNCQVTIYGEYSRKDGMTQRIVFNQNDYQYKDMVLERFVNRKDKLYQRVYHHNEIKEYFHGGRIASLKKHVMVKGVTKMMEFYPISRVDGLMRRIETKDKTVLYFEDREDKLYYKSIKYELQVV